jgi:RNA 3'-terminal phosphate cyclase
VACFAAAPVRAQITGGLFQDFAPSPFHMHRVLAPLLSAMGVDVSLDVIRPGYVPGGGGVIEMTVISKRAGLNPLVLSAAGEVSDVHGIALSSHLAEQRVSERMASTCEAQIRGAGMACAIDRVDDISAVHPGACLAIWAKGNTGCWFGADRAGSLADRRSGLAALLRRRSSRTCAVERRWTVIWPISSCCFPGWPMATRATSCRIPVRTSKATCGSSLSSAPMWRRRPDACRFMG